MKISLITVCLNSESTITDTLKSVMDQGYTDYEHIVFDGGSTDKTVPILKSFKDNIRLIQGQDSGIFDAMNQAMYCATGQIVGIINSDDFYANHQVLSKVVSVFKKMDTDSVYGDLHYVNRNKPDKIYRDWKAGEFRHSKFRFGWTVPHPTFFVRKEIYDHYGMFNSSFKISGDYELILRFLYKHKISTSYIPEVLVKMRTGGNSDGGLRKRFKSLKEDYLSWKKNGLKPSLLTIGLKPIRKIPQLFKAKLLSRPLPLMIVLNPFTVSLY